jgi:hypothetical protein
MAWIQRLRRVHHRVRNGDMGSTRLTTRVGAGTTMLQESERMPSALEHGMNEGNRNLLENTSVNADERSSIITSRVSRKTSHTVHQGRPYALLHSPSTFVWKPWGTHPRPAILLPQDGRTQLAGFATGTKEYEMGVNSPGTNLASYFAPHSCILILV